LIILQEWNDELAEVAQNYADKCIWAHNGDRTGQQQTFSYVGENIGEETGAADYPFLVNMWLNEKEDYDYDTNTCSVGKACGHYTQVSIVYKVVIKKCSNRKLFAIL